MQISKKTMNVLKNYSGINGSIMINPGNSISTVSPGENIFATFESEETFPNKIPLYDLNDFISSLNLFDEPEVDFKEKNMFIKSPQQKMKYSYSPESSVSDPKVLSSDVFKNPKLEIDLSNDTLINLIKAAGVVKANTLSFCKEDDTFKAFVFDKDDSDKNQFEVTIDCDEYEGNFDLHLKTDVFKLLPLDYKLSFFKNFILFSNEDFKIKYAIALEPTSNWS